MLGLKGVHCHPSPGWTLLLKETVKRMESALREDKKGGVVYKSDMTCFKIEPGVSEDPALPAAPSCHPLPGEAPLGLLTSGALLTAPAPTPAYCLRASVFLHVT